MLQNLFVCFDRFCHMGGNLSLIQNDPKSWIFNIFTIGKKINHPTTHKNWLDTTNRRFEQFKYKRTDFATYVSESLKIRKCQDPANQIESPPVVTGVLITIAVRHHEHLKGWGAAQWAHIYRVGKELLSPQKNKRLVEKVPLRVWTSYSQDRKSWVVL